MDRSTHAPRSTAEETVAAELAGVRPGLGAPYASALGGARAAVLTRLWRALAFEPLPWVERRESGPDSLVVFTSGGSRLEGPLPDPYATGDRVGELILDGRVHRRAAGLMAALGVPHGAAFAAELDDSTASLALSRAGQPHEGLDGAPEAGWQWEQRVVDGHPYHPSCRSRPGFSVAEQLAYAPEHRPLVELGTVAVPAGRCLVSGTWPERLRDGDRVLIPVHPWQAEHVLSTRTRWGPSGPGIPAHPLMALRTLAPAGGGPHVKTALSTRLTSSVRDISGRSVESAAVLSDFAQALAECLDGRLHVTRTLGAVTAHSPDLAAVLREPPETYAGPGERVVPVAALAGTAPVRSAAWRGQFARLVLSVCLGVLDLGVALEAHGQNLLVVLSPDGAPVRLVYRDLGDIRISPARLARHGLPVPAVSGRQITDDVAALRRKVFGSAVAGALAATVGSAPALGEALAELASLAPTADSEALAREPIPVKALTLMRLSPGVPGDQWAELPHPITGRRGAG
ncbi:IucA/IucC family protein [Streptomyces sp. NPDC051130]|uniref:IucA/IucC family protein n=1 Tax=Streptomyces sp. NPDC051130 TaxID=3157223 RepID=UPI003443F39B